MGGKNVRVRVCFLPWHKSQSEVGAEAGFTPAGHVVPHLWLTRSSSQAAGAPLVSAAWEGASEDQLSICESIPFSKHSLRSPWPQPSTDASSSLLCPWACPGGSRNTFKSAAAGQPGQKQAHCIEVMPASWAWSDHLSLWEEHQGQPRCRGEGVWNKEA